MTRLDGVMATFAEHHIKKNGGRSSEEEERSGLSSGEIKGGKKR